MKWEQWFIRRRAVFSSHPELVKLVLAELQKELAWKEDGAHKETNNIFESITLESIFMFASNLNSIWRGFCVLVCVRAGHLAYSREQQKPPNLTLNTPSIACAWMNHLDRVESHCFSRLQIFRLGAEIHSKEISANLFSSAGSSVRSVSYAHQ